MKKRSYKGKRKALFKANPNCYYCGILTTYTPKATSPLNPNEATVEHLRSAWTPDAPDETVNACYSCNHARNAKELINAKAKRLSPTPRPKRKANPKPKRAFDRKASLNAKPSREHRLKWYPSPPKPIISAPTKEIPKGKTYQLKMEYRSVARLLLTTIPTDCQHEAELQTTVSEDLQETDYEVTLKLKWHRTTHKPPPWLLPAKKYEWIKALQTAFDQREDAPPATEGAS